MRVIVTGSRVLEDEGRVHGELNELSIRAARCGEQLVVVHGGCRTGADRFAADWCAGVTVCYRDGGGSRPHVVEEVFPADWSQGRKAGPLRNQSMIDAGADLVIGFPVGESRGTYDCLRRAGKAGIPVTVVEAGCG